MERESNPMEALCRSGCGFYGNPSTDGLCSVCFKEALKKKQQPPSTTPSAVSAPFVASTPVPAPAPAPTPLAAAVPTVPLLPAAVQAHTESKCPKKTVQKSSIMENDPSKKESKGKRILQKALRRNSKSSNSSSVNSESGVGASAGVSRSKSYEKAAPTELEEARPAERLRLPASQEGPAPDTLAAQRKSVVFQPDAAAAVVAVSSVLDAFAVPATSKKSLKRKLEDESGAGTSGASAGASDTDADDKDPSKDKKKKNRCAICRKKVGLTGFECRCGGLFCAVHRYSDKHQCSFDYRELGAQEIRRNNPVVVSQKIHKI